MYKIIAFYEFYEFVLSYFIEYFQLSVLNQLMFVHIALITLFIYFI